jgi:hypothetical protein
MFFKEDSLMPAQKKNAKTKSKPALPRPRLKTVSLKVPVWVGVVYFHAEPGREKVGGSLTLQRL